MIKLLLLFKLFAIESPIFEGKMPYQEISKKTVIHLSENISEGKILVLSDKSRWEVHPSDVSTSALWLFPVPIEVRKSDDPNYPYILINTISNSAVRTRKLP